MAAPDFGRQAQHHSDDRSRAPFDVKTYVDSLMDQIQAVSPTEHDVQAPSLNDSNSQPRSRYNFVDGGLQWASLSTASQFALRRTRPHWLSVVAELSILLPHTSAQNGEKEPNYLEVSAIWQMDDTQVSNVRWLKERLPHLSSSLNQLLAGLDSQRTPEQLSQQISNYMPLATVEHMLRLTEWLHTLLAVRYPNGMQALDMLPTDIVSGARVGNSESILLCLHKLRSFSEAIYLDIQIERRIREERELRAEIEKLTAICRDLKDRAYSLPPIQAVRPHSFAPMAQRSRERSLLSIQVNGKNFDALPDTMSSENIMTEEVARGLGVSVDRSASKQRIFVNACGQTFRSVGEAVAKVSFPGESSNLLECRFSILTVCAAPLIMGETFLRTTETLTKFRHRLKKIITAPMKKLWRLCYMNVPRQRLGCWMDSQFVRANADTGSDVDLVSLAYATDRGWKVWGLKPDEGFVELADGTIRKVHGYVDVPLDIGGYSKLKRFYVLDGLVCDMLLGDETLDELDAFNRYEAFFFDVVDEWESDLGNCHNINWVDKIEERTDQILHGRYPSPCPTPPGGQHNGKVKFWKRLTPGNFSRRLAAEDMAAWKEAFSRAKQTLNDLEVSQREQASQRMGRLSGDERRHIEETDKARQLAHAKRIEAMEKSRSAFFKSQALP